MPRRTIRLVTAALCLAGFGLSIPDASAVPHPGTWTKITTPAADLRFSLTSGGPNTFHVAGQTSLDVDTVEIWCVTLVAGGPASAVRFTDAVLVTHGHFSTTAEYLDGNSAPPTCRLAAIPAGVDPETDYTASYTGPLLYTDLLAKVKTGSTLYGYQYQVAEGDGVAVLADAGECGVEVLTTVQRPRPSAGPLLVGCTFALPGTNVTTSDAPTGSAIRVDGHNAYLPAPVNDLIDDGLSVTQSALTFSQHIAANGEVSIRESAVLMRCPHPAFPATDTSCADLVTTGVGFSRTALFHRDGHQVTVRDTFTSLDGSKHKVSPEYDAGPINATNAGTAAGDIGYQLPGHGAKFRGAHPGQVVTGLGKKAASIRLKSDIHAAAGDPETDAEAITWSRAPSQMVFDGGSTGRFGLQYSASVPAHGRWNIGFALSERWSPADAFALGDTAVQEMVTAPKITSPSKGATVHGSSTTVKGTLAAGANGQPTSVTVNGHDATLHGHEWSVTFSESGGKHTITATAHDAVGNTASTSATVTNS